MATELRITEEWIKDRIGIKEDNLEDVKSLSLPGTYHEKITHLDAAFLHFSRLKELDVSRNSIEMLDGIGHLTCLENLNLYYNQINSLNEIYKLRSNTSLQELDLRLNPVARSEPDYRLFVIHMLPSLRKLDDRTVRDQERKAALMHFGTDQAMEFSPPAAPGPVPPEESAGRSRNPRVEQVNRMWPGSSCVPPLSGDQSGLLDLTESAEENESGLMAPRGSGPNRRRDATGVEEYGRKERLEVERRTDNRAPPQPSDGGYGPYGAGYPPEPRDGTYASTNKRGPYPEYQPLNQSASGVSNHGPYPAGESAHDNLYRSQTASHHFTPNPAAGDHLPPAPIKGPSSQPPKHGQNAQDFMIRICDLVDRYWNGSKSLHAHPRFQPALQSLLAEVSPSLATGDDRTSGEADALRRRVRLLEQQLADATAMPESSQHVGRASEVDGLKERLRRSQDEVRALQRRVVELEDAASRSGVPVPAGGGLGDIDRETERLRMEVNSLRVKQKTYEQMAELANMLKESHKSLVQTNDHLMRELAETRERHHQEVAQLQRSYDQLKRTYVKIPEYNAQPTNGKVME